MNEDSKKFEQSVLETVDLALSKAESERTEFLESITDTKLARRVSTILEKVHVSQNMISTGGGVNVLGELDHQPDFIGGYKVVGELGSGGMGVVYLARRAVGDFEQLVAIKVIKRIKSTEQGLSKFRQEMSALSQLRHPNIAQIFDADVTDLSLPYFVMEYVDGQQLSDYLKTTPLSIKQRIHLFLDICDTVAYAHRRLVVHRDLSPANILITDEGHLKLIDFGVSADLNDNPENLLSVPMTPGYSAPENARNERIAVMADVYSLGRVLLLFVDAEPLPRKVDIEAVVAKATEPEPIERYESVDALAADVRRYMSTKPVTAIKSSWSYRARRFALRHFLPLTAGIGTLVGAFAIALVFFGMFLQAERAEQRAEERFEEVRALGSFMVMDLYDEVESIPGSLSVQRMLVQESLDYLDVLSQTPEASADLKIDVADGYRKLGNILGDPGDNNLGEIADAGTLLQKASDILSSIPEISENPKKLRVEAGILMAQSRRAGLIEYKFQDGIEILKKAQEKFRDLERAGVMSPSDRLSSGDAFAQSGYFNFYIENYEIALEELNLAERAFSLSEETPELQIKSQLKRARNNVLIGEVRAWQAYAIDGSYGSSISSFQVGIRQLRALLARSDEDIDVRRILIDSLLKYSSTACEVEEYRESGLNSLDEADLLLSALKVATPKDVSLDRFQQLSTSYRFSCYHQMGKLDQALSIGSQAITEMEQIIAQRGEQPYLTDFYVQITELMAEVKAEANDIRGACQSWENSKRYKRPKSTNPPESGIIATCPYN